MNSNLLLAIFLSASFQLTAQNPASQCLVNDASFNSQDGGCKDLTSGLVWSARSLGSGNFSYASAYAAALDEGGFTDWRLPTKDELIAAAGNGAATHLAGTQGPFHSWSSTTRGNRAWAVRLDTGAAILTLKSSVIGFYCVRTVGGGGGGGVAGGGHAGPSTASAASVTGVGPRVDLMPLVTGSYDAHVSAPGAAHHPCALVVVTDTSMVALSKHDELHPDGMWLGTGVFDGAGRTKFPVDTRRLADAPPEARLLLVAFDPAIGQLRPITIAWVRDLIPTAGG